MNTRGIMKAVQRPGIANCWILDSLRSCECDVQWRTTDHDEACQLAKLINTRLDKTGIEYFVAANGRHSVRYQDHTDPQN